MTTALRGALAAGILLLGILIPSPARADEDELPSTPYELVDRALQTLREDPEDLTTVLDLISAALEIEQGRPTGTVSNLELQSAILAIRKGKLHDAELRLVAALEPDSKAAMHDPLASAPPETAELVAASGGDGPEPAVGSAPPIPTGTQPGTGWEQILGYVIVAAGTVALVGAARAERHRDA